MKYERKQREIQTSIQVVSNLSHVHAHLNIYSYVVLQLMLLISIWDAYIRVYFDDAYSPFHSSLPFEHLGQLNLFTRVCRLFYSILELKQCPRCQMFLKSIQHLSLGNDVTSSDKNIVIASLKHIFISKFFAQHIQCI